ncbi:hypothetical protein JB92DRAFT_2979370 [Gautieria morchelliformis]|nr:hypothetical protein JB92DRAFT_2979370 [Gautieria morchelliformis]
MTGPPALPLNGIISVADIAAKALSPRQYREDAQGHLAKAGGAYERTEEFLTLADREKYWQAVDFVKKGIEKAEGRTQMLPKLRDSYKSMVKARAFCESFTSSSERARIDAMLERTKRELELAKSSSGSQQLSSHVPSGSNQSTTSSPLVNVAASKAAVDKGRGKQRDTSSHVPPGPRQSTTSSPLVNVAASKAAVDKGRGKQRDTSSHVPPGPRQSTTSSPLVNVAASKASGGVNVSQYPDRANTHVSVDKGKGKQRDTSSQVPPGPRQSTTSSQVHVAGSKAAAGPSSSDHSGWTSGTQLPVYTLCSLCPLAFPTVKNFITHMRAAHSKYYICDYCGDHRNTREELEGHVRRNHSSA